MMAPAHRQPGGDHIREDLVGSLGILVLLADQGHGQAGVHHGRPCEATTLHGQILPAPPAPAEGGVMWAVRAVAVGGEEVVVVIVVGVEMIIARSR